jgi:hypothetical protein
MSLAEKHKARGKPVDLGREFIVLARRAARAPPAPIVT